MKRLMAIAALCAAGGAWAQTVSDAGSLSAATFTVNYATSLRGFPGGCGAIACPDFDPPPTIVGGAVVWSPAFTVATGACVQCIPPAAWASGNFSFAALAGYLITGFDVQYSLAMTTDTYTFVGGEYPNLPPGTVRGGMASFSTSTGGAATLDYQSLAVNVLDHIAGPSAVAFDAKFRTEPFAYCPINDSHCGFGGERALPMSATISGITITPHIEAVPEPGVWALMGAGLVTLLLRVRRPGRCFTRT